MKFFAAALIFALWQGEAVLAKGHAASLVRRPLARQVMALHQMLLKQALAGMNVGSNEVILGIDLGTTNSAMAIVKDGVAQIVPNLEGYNTTPSVVNLGEGGGVGDAALKEMEFLPEHVIYSVKRIIGHTFQELADKNLITNLPYKVVKGEAGMAVVEVDGKQYLPQVISAQLLAKLKADAERSLGGEITAVVITVPARFNHSQRLATREAGEIADLQVRRLVAEPTAAALAHGLGKGEENTVVVYDLGGGTFDVSILDMGKTSDGDEMSEVLTTEGNPLLGGDDFDNRIVSYLVEKLKADTGIDVSRDREAMAELKTAAVEAKEALTGSESTTIRLKKLGEQALTLNETFTRARFGELIADLVEQTIAMTKKALATENLTVDDIDRVLMVGGSTRVVAVNEAVEALFGVEKLSREDNPDEVVALGAAVQAGVLSGTIDGITLLDQTSMDLGVGVEDGSFVVIIKKDTTIPTKVISDRFTTTVDNQNSVTIPVYQGDAELVAYNEKIGEFILDGIPPAPKGVPNFEITFEMDADGILKVTAKDTATSKEKDHTVAANAISEERIAAMRASIAENSEEIAAKVKLIEAKNKLDSLLLQAESMLREHGDKLAAESQSTLKIAIEAAQGSVNSDDIEAIENAISGFEAQIHAVTEALYGKAASNE